MLQLLVLQTSYENNEGLYNKTGKKYRVLKIFTRQSFSKNRYRSGSPSQSLDHFKRTFSIILAER